MLDTRRRNGREITCHAHSKGAARAVSSVIAVSLVVLTVACGPKITILPGQGANEVWISGGKLYPEKLIVPIGTTVTWTNKDTKAHTVTSDAGVFDGVIPPGSSFSYTLTEHKNYRYRCATHTGVKGVVFVEPDLRTNCDDCHA